MLTCTWLSPGKTVSWQCAPGVRQMAFPCPLDDLAAILLPHRLTSSSLHCLFDPLLFLCHSQAHTENAFECIARILCKRPLEKSIEGGEERMCGGMRAVIERPLPSQERSSVLCGRRVVCCSYVDAALKCTAIKMIFCRSRVCSSLGKSFTPL